MRRAIDPAIREWERSKAVKTIGKKSRRLFGVEDFAGAVDLGDVQNLDGRLVIGLRGPGSGAERRGMDG